jgi:hypothetical protein
MADLVYMTKATWTAITDAFRNKLGSTEMIKAGDIPSALDSFQKYADLLSYNVTSVRDENATLVRSYCFYSCNNLQEVYLPNVTSVSSVCFSYCYKLQEVYLPNATTIGSLAFAGCNMLSKINIQNVETLGSNALEDAHGITELYLPKAITIGQSACEGVSQLKKVTLGNVKTIGIRAFCRDVNCEEIDISLNENVGSIGMQAFSGNEKLSKLTIRGAALIKLEDSNVFGDTPIANGTGKIYVDPSMVETYKTATNWSNYASVIEAIS